MIRKVIFWYFRKFCQPCKADQIFFSYSTVFGNVFGWSGFQVTECLAIKTSMRALAGAHTTLCRRRSGHLAGAVAGIRLRWGYLILSILRIQKNVSWRIPTRNLRKDYTYFISLITTKMDLKSWIKTIQMLSWLNLSYNISIRFWVLSDDFEFLHFTKL